MIAQLILPLALLPQRGETDLGDILKIVILLLLPAAIGIGKTILDRAKRKILWRRLQEIYVEEVPVIPLYFRANVFVLPPWLVGLEPTGHQDPTTLWVEQWRAE